MRVLISAMLFSFLVPAQSQIAYDLTRPMEVHTLPPALREVAGIAVLDSVTLGCVQDEKGIVYFYDLREKRVTRELAFGADGDYEAISRVGNTLYVLRSDGAIFEVANYRAIVPTVNVYINTIPSVNNEGLVYDRVNKRFLVASKASVEDESRLTRIVFAVRLSGGKMHCDVAYRFDVGRLSARAADSNLIEPFRFTPKGKQVPNYLKVRFSEIGIHPRTGELYLLSAEDHMLFVFTASGKLVELISLDKTLFNKAEGLAFFPNGVLAVSNEGEGGEATVLLFGLKES